MPTITALPDAPSRTDEPATFVTKADAWVAALDTFVTETNALGSYLEGLSAGTLDGNLAAIAAVTSAADTLPYFTGSETAALATFTAAARSLLDDASASEMRTTLGLGTAAVLSTADVDELARDAVGTALTPGTGIAITPSDGSDTITVALSGYSIAPFFTSTPSASEVLSLHVAAEAFTIPANFATPNSVGNCETNPTASFAIDVQRNGVSIGTITISTGGVFTFATTSGTAKAFAVGDVLKLVAPATPDATCANVAITIRGSR